jgi:hypothetical protein
MLPSGPYFLGLPLFLFIGSTFCIPIPMLTFIPCDTMAVDESVWNGEELELFGFDAIVTPELG